MKVQLISNATPRYTVTEGIRLALEGGCRWIQLRMKHTTEADVVAAGREARRLCTAYGARLIVDDYVHLVDPIGADGVHLGRTDMPIDEARRRLGPDKIIGGTANTIDDIRQVARAGANYIGCGPLRFTTTKERLAPLLGIEGYRRLIAQMHEEGIALPLYAIGGITADDLPALVEAGVDGIAVSGSVLSAPNPTQAMQTLINYGE